IDLVDPGNGTPCAAHPAGSPLNVAIGLARLGQPVTFIGRLSRDPFGTILRNHATRSGVDLTLAVEGREPTTIALLDIKDGIARYEFSVDGTVDFQWAESELAHLPASVAWVHFGSLTSWLPPGDQVILRRIAALRAAGDVVVSYDPNVRPQLQPDAAIAREQVEQSLRHAHVVKASLEDLQYMYPGEPAAKVAKRWLTTGPEIVIITRGGDGATAFTAGSAALERPAYPAPAIDTVGAGDAFTSGLLDALARRGLASLSRLRELHDPETLAAVVVAAAMVAGLTTTRPGADPPRRAEVEAEINAEVERARRITREAEPPQEAVHRPAIPRPRRPTR
ncbi:MAG: carbohydrate kinase, partial [Pseudonocardiales bacterium]